MAYTVRFRPAAERTYDKLPEDVRGRLEPEINDLGKNPRPYGYKKLRGMEDLYRIRVGRYRVIYEIHDVGLIVRVVKIGHRSKVYD
jgi:mRNA interferase RelE/StbE